jgi:hypothetical protein
LAGRPDAFLEGHSMIRDTLSLREANACCCVRAPRHVVEGFRPAGRFKVRHFRKGELLAEYDVPNGIVDVGLNHILETEFHSGAQITAWYIGLVDNSGFTAFNTADIMSSHAGWSETSAYGEANRPAWGAGAASGRSITNAVTSDFTMNNTLTVKGLFICGGTVADTKGGTTGTLWSAAAFSSTIAVVSGDVLKITYSLSG